MSPFYGTLNLSSTHTSKNYYQMAPLGLSPHGRNCAETKVCVLGLQGLPLQECFLLLRTSFSALFFVQGPTTIGPPRVWTAPDTDLCQP